jgi:hypothetical protein
MAVTGSQLIRAIAQTGRRCPNGGQSTLHSQLNGVPKVISLTNHSHRTVKRIADRVMDRLQR